MKYLIVEPNTPGVAYNIALMKWARWCEENDYEYQYVRGIVETDIRPDIILMSCAFSFYSSRYEKIINHYLNKFPNVKIKVGGVFPSLNPEWFNRPNWKGNLFFDGEDRVIIHKGMNQDIENIIPKYNVSIKDEDEKKSKRTIDRMKSKKRKIVLYASRGCTNKCKYCAVPSIEGDMRSFKSIKKCIETGKRELPEATSIVLYDNNFTEHEYFDNIIDELVESNMPVDIHGLHVSSFTEHQAKRFSELKWTSQNEKSGRPYLRFSFDKLKYENEIERALILCKKYEIKADFFLYMLYNWFDKPDDFWYRMVRTQELSTKHNKMINMFPQRYEPLDALRKNKFIGKHWNDELLRGIGWFLSWSRGFITLTPPMNLFRWIGFTKEEFFDKCLKLAEDKDIRFKKYTGKLPELKM
jgi:hypothetical protein